jgi:DNA polymerase III epsilon subunit-like protein
MKKIIILLLVILAVIAGIFYFSKNAFAPDAQTDALKSFASWKLYDGKSTMGFTLKYPADWAVTFDENYKDYVDFVPADGNGFAVLVIEATDKKQTLAKWLKARDKENSEVMGGQYKDRVISTKKIKVDKLSAIRRVEYMDAAGFSLIHTYVKKGNSFYMFTLRMNGLTDKYTAGEEKVYNKILSTVQFAK